MAVEEELYIIVEGMVQGVGFRYFTERLARRLGVKGWVRNLASREVEVLARLPAERKTEFLKELRNGPPASRVSGLRIGAAPPSYDPPGQGFIIRA